MSIERSSSSPVLGTATEGSTARTGAPAPEPIRRTGLRCSFCQRTEDVVQKFISGVPLSGPSVYICDGCVALCNDILAEDEMRAPTRASEKARRLVLIEWEDSHANGEWQQIDGSTEDRALVCRSVGWLVLDGKRAKVIAPHMNESEPGVELQGCGIMTIPTRAVMRITDLAVSALSSFPDSTKEGEPK